MNVKLTRTDFTDESTIGELEIDGLFECYILEDKDRKLEDGGVKVQNETAIPRGTYKVIVDFSTRFKRLRPHILDVPQFTGIRIHPGNKADDTEGCLITGGYKKTNFVGESRIAFDALFKKLSDAHENNEEIWIEII